MPTVSKASIDCWEKFLDEIDQTIVELTPKKIKGSSDIQEFWFRGHTRSDHKLMPSLFRDYEDPNEDETWDKIWALESDLFWEFSARARELHNTLTNDWDYLFAMQHYRTPTRLLDWTEILGVAVYFATLGVDESKKKNEKGNLLPPPCVWVMNPYLLNKHTWGCKDLVAPENLGWDKHDQEYYTYSELLLESGIDFSLPGAIYPRQLNPRLHAQRAWFTIHGDEFIPLEELAGHEEFLKKVELPRQAIPAARRFLEHAGIDHYLLFADLENLSLRLKEKNGLMVRK